MVERGWKAGAVALSSISRWVLAGVLDGLGDRWRFGAFRWRPVVSRVDQFSCSEVGTRGLRCGPLPVLLAGGAEVLQGFLGGFLSMSRRAEGRCG